MCHIIEVKWKHKKELAVSTCIFQDNRPRHACDQGLRCAQFRECLKRCSNTLWTEDGSWLQASYICSTYTPEEPLRKGSAAPEEDCLIDWASLAHIWGRSQTRYMTERRDRERGRKRKGEKGRTRESYHTIPAKHTHVQVCYHYSYVPLVYYWDPKSLQGSHPSPY